MESAGFPPNTIKTKSFGNLSIALLLGDFLRLHGYSIVCRSLCKAGAAGNGADIMLLDVNFNGSKGMRN